VLGGGNLTTKQGLPGHYRGGDTHLVATKKKQYVPILLRGVWWGAMTTEKRSPYQAKVRKGALL